MKKIFSMLVLSLALAFANNAVFACGDCDCKKNHDCKCEKVCDKNCDCGCKEAGKCDCKNCKCEKACDCKDCKCENCECKKKAIMKFNFFKSKKIKCNCDK